MTPPGRALSPGRTPRAAVRIHGRRGRCRRRRSAAGRGATPNSRSLIAVIPLSSSSSVVCVGRPRGGHGSAGALPPRPRWPVRVPASRSGLSLRGLRFRGFRQGGSDRSRSRSLSFSLSDSFVPIRRPLGSNLKVTVLSMVQFLRDKRFASVSATMVVGVDGAGSGN